MAVLLASAILAGCGTNSSPSSNTSTRPPVTADEHSNGTTITLRLRQRLVVTLHNTYWQLTPPNANVLQVARAPNATPDPGCTSIPGTGCGTVTAEYVARGAGTAVVSAHRDSCGEALRCTGTAGDWHATVVITP